MKTSQISTRVTQADADFLAGLTLEGATTPSDKVRALITEARRRREELGDYKGSLRQVRDLIGPATAAILEAHDAQMVGVAISLDRMERGTGEHSAIQEVEERYGIPVIAIATADDLLAYLEADPAMAPHLQAISEYRRDYGAIGYA